MLGEGGLQSNSRRKSSAIAGMDGQAAAPDGQARAVSATQFGLNHFTALGIPITEDME